MTFKEFHKSRVTLVLSLFLVGFLYLFPTPVVANGQCSPVFYDDGKLKESINAKWRTGSENLFYALRLNVSHYWAWMKAYSRRYLPKEAFVDGVIVGDVHQYNIGAIRPKNKVEFNIIDFDDGGRGPFVLDLVQYLVRVKSTSFHIKSEVLIEAYKQGLLGEATDMPKFLKTMLEESNEDFDSKQKKYAKKFTNESGTKFNYVKGLIKPMRTAPKVVRDQLLKDKPFLIQALSDYKILDYAYKIKEEGGSRGLVRFWMLAEKDKELFVFEAKQFVKPALNEYQPQLLNSERIDLIFDHYFSDPSHQHKVVHGKNSEYWLRPRYKFEYKFEKLTIEKGSELLLYLAQWLGQKHAEQKESEPLIKYIKKSKSNFDTKILKIVNKYFLEAQHLFKEEIHEHHNFEDDNSY